MDALLLDATLKGKPMALMFATPPVDAWDVLVAGLQTVATGQLSNTRGGTALDLGSTMSAMKPHPVYSLGLSDLAAGSGQERAKLVAWRYLLVENQQVRQAAEVVPEFQGGTGYRFGSLTTGYVAGAAQALALADSDPEVVVGSYEIRALQVPALNVMALWLKDLSGANDQFILLPPVFRPLQANTVYSAHDLLAALRTKATAKLALEQRVAEPVTETIKLPEPG